MTADTEETPLWRGTPSQWTNFGTYLFSLLLAAGVIAAYYYFRTRTTVSPLVLLGLVVPVLWTFSRWIGTRTIVYELTSERIKVTTGLLSRRTNELELYR